MILNASTAASHVVKRHINTRLARGGQKNWHLPQTQMGPREVPKLDSDYALGLVTSQPYNSAAAQITGDLHMLVKSPEVREGRGGLPLETCTSFLRLFIYSYLTGV